VKEAPFRGGGKFSDRMEKDESQVRTQFTKDRPSQKIKATRRGENNKTGVKRRQEKARASLLQEKRESQCVRLAKIERGERDDGHKGEAAPLPKGTLIRISGLYETKGMWKKGKGQLLE